MRRAPRGAPFFVGGAGPRGEGPALAMGLSRTRACLGHGAHPSGGAGSARGRRGALSPCGRAHRGGTGNGANEADGPVGARDRARPCAPVPSTERRVGRGASSGRDRSSNALSAPDADDPSWWKGDCVAGETYATRSDDMDGGPTKSGLPNVTFPAGRPEPASAGRRLETRKAGSPGPGLRFVAAAPAADRSRRARGPVPVSRAAGSCALPRAGSPVRSRRRRAAGTRRSPRPRCGRARRRARPGAA